MPKRRRTPQEKKRLSLTRDRRNTYGNSTKAARKIIPRRKRMAARAERHGTSAALNAVIRVVDANLIHPEPKALRGSKHRHWRKFKDDPLGKVIAKQQEKRAARMGRKAREKARAVAAMPPNTSLKRTRDI